MRKIALGLIVLACAFQAGEAIAQDKSTSAGDKGHTFAIREKYDRFADTTTLELDYGKVRSDSSNNLELAVLQLFKGRGRSDKVGRVVFDFVNDSSDGWRYVEYHPIAFLIDGERMKFEPKYDGTTGKGCVTEFLHVYLSEAQFLKMLNAKEVHASVGLEEFDLKKSHLSALKDFASYVDNPARHVPPAK
jgi:hypothetical protein